MRPASPAAWSAKDARGRTCDPRGQRHPRRGIHWAQAVGSRRWRRAVREVSTASHNHVPFRNHADAGEHPPTPTYQVFRLRDVLCGNVRLSCHVHNVGEQRSYVTACSVERETRICRPVLPPCAAAEEEDDARFGVVPWVYNAHDCPVRFTRSSPKNSREKMTDFK